jgi:hypothetical protein
MSNERQCNDVHHLFLWQCSLFDGQLSLANLIAVHRLSVGVGDWVAAVGLVSSDGGVVSMVALFALGVRSMLGSMGGEGRAWAVGGVSHGRILRESSDA